MKGRVFFWLQRVLTPLSAGDHDAKPNPIALELHALECLILPPGFPHWVKNLGKCSAVGNSFLLAGDVPASIQWLAHSDQRSEMSTLIDFASIVQGMVENGTSCGADGKTHAAAAQEAL